MSKFIMFMKAFREKPSSNGNEMRLMLLPLDGHLLQLYGNSSKKSHRPMMALNKLNAQFVESVTNSRFRPLADFGAI